MQQANFYKTLTAGAVSCRLCNHFCNIGLGEVGICGLRRNVDGKLYSLNYGRPSVMNIDPIEKKPLYHFYPGSRAYSLGTLGCNFACDNCHNHEISQPQNALYQNQSLEVVSPERIVEEAISNDCESIAFTYNEPTVFSEYAIEIMKLAKSADLKTVWISNGYMSKECLDAIIPYLDAINVDIKSFDEDFYNETCRSRLNPILDNLIRFKQEQTHLEITSLIIPTISDDISMLERLADFIVSELDADTPWHLSKFFPQKSWKLKSFSETSEDIMYEAYEIAKEAGIKYVYVGNMPGEQKDNTYCPKCHELAIRRIDENVERFDVNGHCSNCDRSLDIIE